MAPGQQPPRCETCRAAGHSWRTCRGQCFHCHWQADEAHLGERCQIGLANQAYDISWVERQRIAAHTASSSITSAGTLEAQAQVVETRATAYQQLADLYRPGAIAGPPTLPGQQAVGLAAKSTAAQPIATPAQEVGTPSPALVFSGAKTWGELVPAYGTMSKGAQKALRSSLNHQALRSKPMKRGGALHTFMTEKGKDLTGFTIQ